MRFIKKTTSPQTLKSWKQARKRANQDLAYGNLNSISRSDLKDLLISEQKGICCYCEQRITKENSTIEHFLPQANFKKHEVEYLNLHLACNYSRGKKIKKEDQYCDVSKHNDLIINVILHPDCETFFRYSKNGEILPNDFSYKNFTEFNKNVGNLTLRNQAILHLINVLNLNSNDLKIKRIKTINDTLKALNKISDNKKRAYLAKEEAKPLSNRFPSLIKYFIKKEID